jgi:hypothetical protein
MEPIDESLRDRIVSAVCSALQPLPSVLAGWEGGSAAFGAVDGYSDIDLNFLVDDDAACDLLYAAAEASLETVSPITASHFVPPGRYYKLKDGGPFLLVDLCFFRAGAPDHHLEVERHGHVRALFDKGDWLRARPLDEGALAAKRDKRYRELQAWFAVSQNFVRKAVLRGREAEALASFWSYTLKPLAELLRMRYCPARWDFGMRYLDRDLPPTVYNELRDLVFVRDLDELEAKLARASAWGAALLQEPGVVAHVPTGSNLVPEVG